jgi:SAM-dependent methyltransferase
MGWGQFDAAAAIVFREMSVNSDRTVQSEVLEALTSARNYRAWLCDLALDYLGDDPLEVGSGLGDYAAEWLDRGVPRITVSERDPERLAMLRTRFARDRRVGTLHVDLTHPQPGAFSSVAAFNVLEHIEDDTRALRGMCGLVRPRGAVIVFVPAVPAAMSRFDRRIGHWRRYSAVRLRNVMERAGLDVERLHYVNAAGLVAWFVGMRLLGMEPREGVLLAAWDRLVVPPSRALESRLRLPVGQSLFAVGRA